MAIEGRVRAQANANATTRHVLDQKVQTQRTQMVCFADLGPQLILGGRSWTFDRFPPAPGVGMAIECIYICTCRSAGFIGIYIYIYGAG